MRKLLFLLSSLALAASSQAIGHAESASSLDVTFTLGAGQSFQFLNESEKVPGRLAGQYVYNWDSDGAGNNPVYEYLDDSNFDIVAPVDDPSRYDLSLLSGHSGGSVLGNRIQLSADSSLTFASNDADQFAFRRYGYRYFLKVTGGATDEDVTFDFGPQGSRYAGSTDIPYDYSRNLGQYAEAGTAGDVRNILDAQVDDYVRYGDTANSPTLTSFSRDDTLSHTKRIFKVLAGQEAEFEIYCSAYAFVEDDHRAAPVPEPAAFLPLGLGALALRRCRA